MDISNIGLLLLCASVQGVIVRNPPSHYCDAVITCNSMGDLIDYVITDKTTNSYFTQIMYQHKVKTMWIKRRDWMTIGWSCPEKISDPIKNLDKVICPFLALNETDDDDARPPRFPGDRSPSGEHGHQVVQNWGPCNAKMDVLCEIIEEVNDSYEEHSEDGMSTGVIAGIVIGSLVAVTLIVLMVFLIITVYKLKIRADLIPESEENPRYSYTGHPTRPRRRVTYDTLPELGPRPATLYRQPTKNSGTYAEINDAALDSGDTPPDSGSDMTFDFQETPDGAMRHSRKISIASSNGQIIIDFDRLKNRVDLHQGTKKRKLDVIDDIDSDDEVTLVDNSTYFRPPLRRSGVVNVVPPDMDNAADVRVEETMSKAEPLGHKESEITAQQNSSEESSEDDVSLVDNNAYESGEDISNLDTKDVKMCVGRDMENKAHSSGICSYVTKNDDIGRHGNGEENTAIEQDTESDQSGEGGITIDNTIGTASTEDKTDEHIDLKRLTSQESGADASDFHNYSESNSHL